MAVSVIQRDHLVDNPLDRIRALEERVARLERELAMAVLALSAGSGGTGAAWIAVDGGYIRVYATK